MGIILSELWRVPASKLEKCIDYLNSIPVRYKILKMNVFVLIVSLPICSIVYLFYMFSGVISIDRWNRSIRKRNEQKAWSLYNFIIIIIPKMTIVNDLIKQNCSFMLELVICNPYQAQLYMRIAHRSLIIMTCEKKWRSHRNKILTLDLKNMIISDSR